MNTLSSSNERISASSQTGGEHSGTFPIRLLFMEILNEAAWLRALLCLLALILLAGGQEAVADTPLPNSESFAQRRTFRGFVRRDMAEHAATVAAEVAAYDQAVRMLARESDVNFALESGGNGKPGPLSLDGLARMVFSTRVTAVGVEGFPPDMRAVVYISLVPPASPRTAVVRALQRHDLLELYGHSHAGLRSLVARYDALAPLLLPLNPTDHGGREELFTLQSIVNEMKALEMFLELVPHYDQRWDDPKKIREGLLRAETLAPDNPLILTGLSEAFLQLDRPVNALEYVGRALRHAPGYARAHDVKGAVLLRQRLPALAAESFGRAIAIAPNNPAHYMHRASAYLVLEEESAMCADFKRACGLGECEGLKWANSVGRCLAE